MSPDGWIFARYAPTGRYPPLDVSQSTGSRTRRIHQCALRSDNTRECVLQVPGEKHLERCLINPSRMEVLTMPLAPGGPKAHARLRPPEQSAAIGRNDAPLVYMHGQAPRETRCRSVRGISSVSAHMWKVVFSAGPKYPPGVSARTSTNSVHGGGYAERLEIRPRSMASRSIAGGEAIEAAARMRPRTIGRSEIDGRTAWCT